MTKRIDRPEDTCCEGCYGMVYIPELDRRFILCNNPRSDHYGHVLDASHSCREHGLKSPEDEEWFRAGPLDIVEVMPPEATAQLAYKRAEQFRGVISGKAIKTIARLIIFCHSIHASIESLTDRDILNRRNVGRDTLAEIRKVIKGDHAEGNSKEIPSGQLGSECSLTG